MAIVKPSLPAAPFVPSSFASVSLETLVDKRRALGRIYGAVNSHFHNNKALQLVNDLFDEHEDAVEATIRSMNHDEIVKNLQSLARAAKHPRG